MRNVVRIGGVELVWGGGPIRKWGGGLGGGGGGTSESGGAVPLPL